MTGTQVSLLGILIMIFGIFSYLTSIIFFGTPPEPESEFITYDSKGADYDESPCIKTESSVGGDVVLYNTDALVFGSTSDSVIFFEVTDLAFIVAGTEL